MLRFNFPDSKDDAKKYGVEFSNNDTVFKVFNHNLNIDQTVKDVNDFLVKNGYEQVPIKEFINNDYSFESSDEILSLGKHGYIEALVLFISRESDTILNGIRKQLCLEYLKARNTFLKIGNKDKVLQGNDNIIGRIVEAIAYFFLEQQGRKPKIVENKSNPGYDIICKSDDAKISVKMITSENKTGSTSKIRHQWSELIGIELDDELKVKRLGIITRQNFEKEQNRRGRILEPNFSRAMLKENGIFNIGGKLYNYKDLEDFELLN